MLKFLPPEFKHVIILDTFYGKTQKYYYLFNPYNRLGWLKIRQGIDRITIAKAIVVKKIVTKALLSELLMFDNPRKIMNEIWMLKKACHVL